MTHINLELYRVFCITARLGSISAAAKELYMTQPAVSQSIKTLENKLGGVLFLRTKKGVSLTGEGEIFCKQLKESFLKCRICNPVKLK
jgi:DNA-binding transcriptional LysR family regulator